MMKQAQKDHVKVYGPFYAVLVAFAGGGGAAAITDNIPLTTGQFTTWTEEHTAGVHTQSSEAIDKINFSLNAIMLESVRNQLKTAYSDKCHASGATLAYIDREIERLEDAYFKLTKREYDPPPCQ